MAYIEVWKSGKLLTRRRVDAQKAQSGCRIRLGSAGEVRVALGKPETLGDFEVRVFEGEPPEVVQQDRKTASIMPADAQADSTAQTDQMSEYPDIEGYKIIEPLGEGGMGIVWRAEQLSTRREVALKLLISHRADSAKAQARFQREVELTARLDHPNIARIYDSGLHQGMYYYAMELIEGLPLDNYVKSRTFSRTQILALMQKVCQAVLYAHLRAVIHRDLKPSNIIISPDGQPHILDFGLAKALLDEEESVTISIEGQIAGTPAYMSPEQASGHHDQLDTRTDVFSLGVILYELITGQSPHDLSCSMFDLLKQIASGGIQRPSEVDKTIDNELEALLLKALARNPEERYASAGALAKDITNYLDEEPLDARVPTTLYFLRKKAFKYKKQVGIAAAVLVVVFVGVIAAYTRIVGQRAVLRASQERNKSLATELSDLRNQILNGNKEQVEAALAVLEEKYLAAQRNVEQLQQQLEDTVIPAEPELSKTGFYFGEPINLGKPINTSYLDAAPSFSRDGLEMYICSNRVGSLVKGNSTNEDIWVSKRESIREPWGVLTNLGPPINSVSKEFMPYLSIDGLALLFTSDRPGGYGQCDLYMIERIAADEPWSEPENLGPVINSERNDSDPTISADGLTLYFSSDREGVIGREDIWVSSRATRQDPWGTPVNLGTTINSESQEVMPFFSVDGLILLFASDRPGGYGRRDIYVSRRASLNQPWSEPVNLGPIVNSSQRDDLPFISPDSSAIYFNSERSGGFGDFDIWQIPIIRTGDFSFGKPVNLGVTINSSVLDRGPSISSDGLELYFDSNRGSGFGEWDIWLSTRTSTSEPWGKPVNLGENINSTNIDAQPYISPDGLSLLFHSNRPGGSGSDDLWMTIRLTKQDDWIMPFNLGPEINTPSYEGSPCISEDGLTLYFSSTRAGGYGESDLWSATRKTVSDPWSEPVNLGPSVNTSFSEDFPRILPDGLSLFFNSDRSGGYGKSDIWFSTRADISEPWGPPFNPGPPVNSSYQEAVPSISEYNSILIWMSGRPGGSGGDDLWQVPILTNRGFTFGEPVNAGGNFNTPFFDGAVTFIHDGLELYLCSRRPGGLSEREDIWMMRRDTVQARWNMPVNLGPEINSISRETMSRLSDDGLELYFSSDRPGGVGNGDIYVSRRTGIDQLWSEPENLGAVVNSPGTDSDPAITADGLVLYFTSDRTGGYGDYDIWFTRRQTKQAPWEPPVNLGPPINTFSRDIMPYISSDGLKLLFASDRPGGYGRADIYISRRTTIEQNWSAPKNLGPVVNSSEQDDMPFISPEDSEIFFNSDRAGGLGDHDLWRAPIIPNIDINSDGKIDISDLEMLIENWGPGTSRADIAPLPLGDSRVDEKDIELFVDYWRQERSRPVE